MRRSPRAGLKGPHSAHLLVALVAAACTTIVGFPDLPDVATGGRSGRPGAGGAASGSAGAHTSNAGGGGGRGGASAGGAMSVGGSGPSSGGANAMGGTTGTSGGDTGAPGGSASGESAGGSDVGATSGSGGSQMGGSSSGGTGGSGGSGTGGTDTTGGATNAGSGGKAGSGAGGGAGSSTCTQCNGSCVELATTDAHCGACGYACVNGRQCVDGRCTPAWQPISTVGSPDARAGHAAAFVAGKYVVFGGSIEYDGPALDTAGAYNPETDTWSAVAPLKAARVSHAAVSTGTEIYTFGGTMTAGSTADVGPGLERYVPNAAQGTWTTMTAAGAPSPRYYLNMLWTGSFLVVYGGQDGSTVTLSSGGRFEPTNGVWTDASCGLANCDRNLGVFFMEGTAAHYMGGSYNEDYPVWNGNSHEATTGLSYDPANNSWSTWPQPDDSMGVGFGPQVDDGRRIYFPTGGNYVGIYDRQTGWLPPDRSTMPAGLCGYGAAYAWSGTEMIGWSGNCSSPTKVGGRFQPAAPP